MKAPKNRIIAYVLFLMIGMSSMILLWLFQNKLDWITSILREVLIYTLIGITIAFLLVVVHTYWKYKSRKIVFFGLIGMIPSLLATPVFKASLFCDKNGLNENVETLELIYIAWACDCARWGIMKNGGSADKEKDEDSLFHACIFIEPAKPSLKLPDTIGYNSDIVRFTGQFYNKRGFPKGFLSFENPDAARVFRYKDYEVIKSNYCSYQDLETELKSKQVKW